MKLYERLVEDKLRQVIEISSTQFGFQQGKSTTGPIVSLRMMQEKNFEKRQNLHYDLCRSQKRDIIWRAPRTKNVGEYYALK